MTQKIAIIGSTGSIGRQTLEVVDAFPDRFQVLGLTAAKNVDLLEEQIKRYRPAVVGLMDEEAVRVLRARVANRGVKVVGGLDGIIETATLSSVQVVVMAVTGMIGLLPTLEAIRAGKTIALANKETLVTGGELVTAAAREAGVKLVPVDSEHSAIWQCLQGQESAVEKLILTASGGPFRTWELTRLETVTPELALKHPNWVMGPKITVDSATMMNKGLEVIEARWLFGIDYNRIEVVIHPQSVIHSMVAFHDGSVLAQMGVPDMRVPIQYALSWPERWPNRFPRVDFQSLQDLTFSSPDLNQFPNLALAYHAGREGGSMPVVLNAANEVAVALFLQEKIRFTDIPRLVGEAMEGHNRVAFPDLDSILEIDAIIRKQVYLRGLELSSGM